MAQGSTLARLGIRRAMPVYLVATNWLFLGMVAAALTAVCVFGIFVSLSARALSGRAVADLTVLTAAALAAAACLRASLKGGPQARGWTLLAVACGLWASGGTIWMWHDLTFSDVPLFSAAPDFGYFGFLVAAAAALLMFTKASPRLATRRRVVVDVVVVCCAVIFIGWATDLGPLYHASHDAGFARVTSVAYLTGQGAIASLVLILGMRRPAGSRLPWLLLGSGLTLLAVSDGAGALPTLAGPRLNSTTAAIAWVAGFALIALATAAPVSQQTAPTTRRFILLQDALPYLPLLAAILVAAARKINVQDPFLLGSGVVLLVAAGVRQAVIMSDHAGRVHEAELRLAHDRFQMAFDNAPIGMAMTDIGGTFQEVNRVFCRMLGRTESDLLGRKVLEFTVPEDVPASAEFLAAAASGDVGSSQLVKRYRHADGSEVCAVVGLSVVNRAGHPAFVVAQAEDITERLQAESALARERSFADGVMENVETGIVACDAEGNLTVFNRASRKMHGLPLTTVLPEQWPDHYNLYRADGVTPLPTAEIPLFRALRGETVRDAEMVIAPKDGSERFLLVNGHSINGASGELLGAVVAMHDVTERRAAEAALIRQILHDPLTDLANRTLLVDRLGHSLERRARRRAPLALLTLNLDGFKAVNDRLGHDAGDGVLITLAARLRQCLRPDDTIARLGGDEFAVLLDNTTRKQAVGLTKQVLTSLRQPIDVDGQVVNVNASAGIMVSLADETVEEILRNAGLAMYAAKAAGSGTVQVYEASMHEVLLDQINLQAELHQAVAEQQFAVRYQPVVSLVTGCLTGFEALVRWQHPRRGLVLPMEFIPQAEATGLIVPLGSYVLREACRQARLWQDRYPAAGQLTMSVNLSVRQLQEPDIVETVSAILADAGLAPSSLVLEITESVVMHRAEAYSALDRLHDIGVGLAIDDFGTGYSSLDRLTVLPVDQVKIDRSFVAALGGGGISPIIAATIAMAHGLGLQVVAEGVESVDQLPFLRLHGCDNIQGYLLGAAADPDQIDALMGDDGASSVWANVVGPAADNRIDSSFSSLGWSVPPPRAS